MIPQLGTPRRRTRKGLINAGGDLLGFLFGVSKESDLEGLRSEVEAIKKLTAIDTAESKRSREAMSSFTKLSNERLDNMHRILSEEHHTLNSIELAISNIKDTLMVEYNVIAFITREL